MSVLRRGRFIASATLVPLVAVLAACGGSSSGGQDPDAGETPAGACPSNISETAATQPPDDIPVPDGADSAYEYFKQGATQVFNFALDGDGGELVGLRDAYDSALEGKGYDIMGTDQEPGFEAESEFDGPHNGTTNFRVLCDSKVVFRLKLES